jgi:TIR domain-containing protein
MKPKTKMAIDPPKDPLLAGSLRTLLVGTPQLDRPPSTEPPSPLARLFLLSLCTGQLILYFLAAAGGIMLWSLARLQGWDDPLKTSLWLSLALEGWCVVGVLVGLIILFFCRRWAVPSGIEWGWMTIRLGLLVFATLFAVYLLGVLKQDVTISLITSLCLIPPAFLFWRFGIGTIQAIKSLTPEHFAPLRDEHLIFLSYRREDSQTWTERIADVLKQHFGKKAVFQDVEAMPPGADFRQHLQSQLQHCRVVLAVIGPQWVTAIDEHGNRRLDDEQDWVRYEIELALQYQTALIPLLVDNATPPPQEQLPESIRQLAFQTVHRIRSNPDFRSDMNKLIQAIEAKL